MRAVTSLRFQAISHGSQSGRSTNRFDCHPEGAREGGPRLPDRSRRPPVSASLSAESARSGPDRLMRRDPGRGRAYKQRPLAIAVARQDRDPILIPGEEARQFHQFGAGQVDLGPHDRGLTDGVGRRRVSEEPGGGRAEILFAPFLVPFS